MDRPSAFTSAVEIRETDEDQTIAELVRTLLKISTTTYQDGHHALRSVHAKSHAILTGTLSVLPNLAPELAQGIFSSAASYPVIMRLSSTPGDLLNDSVSTPRGLAVKVIGVPGERLPGSEADRTQDFIMINGPVFAAPNAKKFLGSLKLLAGTTDKAPALKSVLSATLRGAEKLLESVGGQSGTLKSLGGEPATNPLGETYFTQVPMRYGGYMAKLSLAPISDALMELRGNAGQYYQFAECVARDYSDILRRRRRRLGTARAVVPRLEKNAHRGCLGTLVRRTQPTPRCGAHHMPQQDSWTQARAEAVDDRTSFSPWHGIVEHQPLGSVMRARRAAYEASVKFRSECNSVAITEARDSSGARI